MNRNWQNEMSEVVSTASQKTIPFDYAFRFKLTGERDKVHKQIITVSIEATFVAVSIGYGVIPEVTSIKFGPKPVWTSTSYFLKNLFPREMPTNFNPIPVFANFFNLPDTQTFESSASSEAIFKSGFKLNPEFADIAFSLRPLDPEISKNMFQAIGAPPDQIQFLYALYDEGTGREFQSEPILNTAGLGTSNGDRPFRYFAKPIAFAPRSTIRMEISEISEFKGELHISLNGYKVLGQAGTPTARIQEREKVRRRRR